MDELATVDGKPLDLVCNAMQDKIFWGSTAKYITASCGRRAGKTQGAAQFLIDTLFSVHDKKVMWIDVQYRSVVGYVETYFLPIMNKISKKLWSWKPSRRELRILDNVIEFRSSDRPDMLVGLGYWMVVLNEAGISLFKQPNLWFQYVAPMLLDHEDSRAFLIGTPRGMLARDGKESIFYSFFKKGQVGGSEYDPHYASFKFSTYDNKKPNGFLVEDDIRKLEEETPARIRLQELHGEFVSGSDSSIFLPEWWQYCEDVPGPEFWERTFISIDSAFSEKTSADESAATVWIKAWDGRFFCIDCWHDRVTYPDLLEATKKLILRYQPHTVLIENKASGQSLIQSLRRDLPDLHIAKFPGEGVKMMDKVNRAAAISSHIEMGKVFLKRAPWNADLVNQCTLFPDGDHDDICFVSGTMIATPFGDRPIETLRMGDMVITPLGLRMITNLCVNDADKVITKLGLTCTPNHPVFSHDGFERIDTISQPILSILTAWKTIQWSLLTALSSRAGFTAGLVGKELITTIARTIPHQSLGEASLTELWKLFIRSSGRDTTLVKRYLQAGMFIMSTITKTIMSLTIYACYRLSSITASVVGGRAQMLKRSISRLLGLLQSLGTSQKRAAPGTDKMLQGQEKKTSLACVLGATNPSMQPIAMPSSAAATVTPNGDTVTIPAQLIKSAPVVISPSLPSSWAQKPVSTAQDPAPLADQESSPTVPVYNIEVEQAHCYYANRILVGNCDTISQALLWARIPGAGEKKGNPFISRKVVGSSLPASVVGNGSPLVDKMQGYNGYNSVPLTEQLRGYR